MCVVVPAARRRGAAAATAPPPVPELRPLLQHREADRSATGGAAAAAVTNFSVGQQQQRRRRRLRRATASRVAFRPVVWSVRRSVRRSARIDRPTDDGCLLGRYGVPLPSAMLGNGSPRFQRLPDLAAHTQTHTHLLIRRTHSMSKLPSAPSLDG